MKIFIDTAPFIYLIEEHPDFAEKVKAYFIDRFKSGDEFVTSVVTLSEFSVKPIRDQRLEIIVQLKDFIEHTGIDVLPISLIRAELAAKLRGKYQSLKGMDAFQVAVAIDEGCEKFLTNDKDLVKLDELEVVLVAEL
ncbi:PIN domain-containing protein [Neolewinella lacunae]|uniref:Type II toxin-antitoxin system VapC family toxin n=1 Tax=Neolewinella lacunae TaxID=1517758 RepID=A0A923PHF0_9BACT|nr:PIN domain-containing protein [Neolewinella lacunae]MBC6994125.1 type II toxin-antitoxin system VapC family toxin [Neolewinella lacunae]MDN3636726.1 PIN domain-containing protein [Neolewinella lacunae]